MPTLFERAGGEEALHRLEQVFYDSVLADPLLRPRFGAGRPSHVDHLTAFTAESFGAQRKRFVELYLAALDAAGMPSDAAFREAVREHVEFGSKVAMQNSHADTDDQLHPLREVPRWTWPGDGD
jgi:hemoglobin